MTAVYIHWPFCISKCPYCDFNSRVGDTADQEIWRRAYRRELEHYANLLPKLDVGSIYFGGGTPSLMEVQTVESVIQDISRLWRIEKNAEITLEANPSSVEAGKFVDFRNAGINRLSLGVQSFDDKALKFLGRAHNSAEARKAITLAEKHFTRFSFDMIYGYKGQNPEKWVHELCEALELAKGHISLYQLTIEPRTPFALRADKGEKLVANEDDAYEMFEITQEITNDAGFPAYEISNHARTGHESRHNLTYWRYEDYIGIGPGAHGRYVKNGVRYAVENNREIATWLEETLKKGAGIKSREALDDATAMREALMMGLRLTEGIDLARWREKFPMPLPSFLPSMKLDKLKKEGFMFEDEKTLRATAAGLQRLDSILAFLL